MLNLRNILVNVVGRDYDTKTAALPTRLIKTYLYKQALRQSFVAYE